MSSPIKHGPARWSASALVTGGALMIIMYTLQIVHGLRTGEVMTPENSKVEPLLWLSGFTFCAALVIIALGLVGLGMWLRQRSPRLGWVAIVLPAAAALAPALCMVTAFTVDGVPRVIQMFNGLSVICNLASATILGIAVLRTRALSTTTGWTLVAVGLATFPLILLTIPAEQIMPAYVAMDMPFPGWGMIFAILGLMLRRNAPEHPTPVAATA